MRSLALLALALAGGLAPGCAVFEEENRRLLNLMDEGVRPEGTAAQVALAPIGVPVGTVALATDMLVVHPVAVVPDAADDVYEWFWKPRDMDAFRKALIFPLIVVATPPTFVGDWLARSLFAIDS